jgi:hypothetical protein
MSIELFDQGSQVAGGTGGQSFSNRRMIEADPSDSPTSGGPGCNAAMTWICFRENVIENWRRSL